MNLFLSQRSAVSPAEVGRPLTLQSSLTRSHSFGRVTSDLSRPAQCDEINDFISWTMILATSLSYRWRPCHFSLLISFFRSLTFPLVYTPLTLLAVSMLPQEQSSTTNWKSSANQYSDWDSYCNRLAMKLQIMKILTSSSSMRNSKCALAGSLGSHSRTSSTTHDAPDGTLRPDHTLPCGDNDLQSFKDC